MYNWNVAMQKSELAFAILSSYALDIAWVYQFFDPSVPVIIGAHPSGENSSSPSVHYALPNWIKTMPRLRGLYGCMHMKVGQTSFTIQRLLLIFVRTRHSLCL